MLAKLKRDAKDLAVIGTIVIGLLLVLALILGPIAFEVLKVFAVIKYLFS